MSNNRRDFLLSAFGMAVVGCKKDDRETADTAGIKTTDTGSTTDSLIDCPDELDGGQFLAIVPFIGEPARELETLYGEGLDGRYVVDLATLAPDTLALPSERFFVRTREPGLIDTSNWVVTITGLVAADVQIPIADITALATPQGEVHFECSGNTNFGGFGLQSAASFDGVPVGQIFAMADIDPQATLVMIAGFDEHSQPGGSEPGASWIYPVADLEAAGAFFATHMNGEPLPADHGFPVRLVIPGWYGCTMAKWVDTITWVDDTTPATSQMVEFSSRTHQPGTPTLAVDFIPAVIDRAAMPVRVERWTDAGGETAYLIIGIIWGGEQVTDDLIIHFDGDGGRPVQQCELPEHTRTWALWSHVWRPEKKNGTYEIAMSIDNAAVRTRRLDDDYYARSVDLSG